MPRIAVLGASSFSGKAFCEHAVSEGHEVLELSRPVHDVNKELLAITALVEKWKADHFVNFAALNVVAESWLLYEHYFRTNIIGLAKLHDWLRRWGKLRRYVQVSTPEVYGTTEFAIKETTAYKPSTPYAISRAAQDMYLAALHSTYGFPVCFTRTVNVYGRGQQPYRIIPKTVLSILRGWKLKLHGGGVSTRSFIHINDVADATLKVMLNGRPGDIYHAATPRQTAIKDLVAMVCGVMGRNFDDVVEVDDERPGKDMAYQLDDSKIRAELGWSDVVQLETGLSDAVKWFADRAADYAESTLEYQHKA